MYFDILKNEYGYESAENKQRLNLSDRAYTVLENDNSIFEKNDEDKITSALINRIFCNYAETAQASIAVVLQNRRSELSKLLKDISSKTEQARIVDILIQNEEAQLKREIKPLLSDKGNALIIRLNKESLEYLASDIAQDEAVFYDNNIGKYLKAIIEEYASLSYVERERIYYKEWVEEITKALMGKKLLKVELKTTNKLNGVIKQNLSYVQPYAMVCDSENLYNYLIGYVSSSPEGPWNMQSIRLSSIKKCKKQEHSAILSDSEKKAIESSIRQKGVQYLSSDKSAHIVVEFTEEGEKRYRKMLHLRPVYTSKNGLKYEFDCTIFQAETYFFKFGHHVKILEPQILAQKFYRQYKSAANRYQEFALENK